METTTWTEWTVADAERWTRDLVGVFAVRGWDVDVRVDYAPVEGVRAWQARLVVHATRAWAPSEPYTYAEVVERTLADALLRLGQRAEDAYCDAVEAEAETEVSGV